MATKSTNKTIETVTICGIAVVAALAFLGKKKAATAAPQSYGDGGFTGGEVEQPTASSSSGIGQALSNLLARLANGSGSSSGKGQSGPQGANQNPYQGPQALSQPMGPASPGQAALDANAAAQPYGPFQPAGPDGVTPLANPQPFGPFQPTGPDGITPLANPQPLGPFQPTGPDGITPLSNGLQDGINSTVASASSDSTASYEDGTLDDAISSLGSEIDGLFGSYSDPYGLDTGNVDSASVYTVPDSSGDAGAYGGDGDSGGVDNADMTGGEGSDMSSESGDENA